MSKTDRTFLPEVGFVREPAVLAHVGVGRTKWREMVAAGHAPSPIKFGERIVVYNAIDVRRWIADQIRDSKGGQR